ncbi:ergothioneine biosynthesis protein EgtB [Kangiella marina]|uniref:Ergothioneine biosynthesis protein EgtB n=1 Tax=Kangiella marina TaxID=1079178 RepID=A0ABP8IPG3_9GAMM
MLDKVRPNTQLGEVVKQFNSTRELTERLCQSLDVEDYNLQAIAETSPVKWHLAHTSWFFETFILKHYAKSFEPYHPQFEYLFNSYYNAVGKQFRRPERHLLSRPTVGQIFDYRQKVTEAVNQLLALSGAESDAEPSAGYDVELLSLIVLGIHHEQQHQELLLTDLKYNFYQNPLYPSYLSQAPSKAKQSQPEKMAWIEFGSELCSIGADLSDQSRFKFDNETPQHQHFINGFKVANRLVTNEEYIEFIEQGGYEASELWLSDGWEAKKHKDWQAPLYWFKKNGEWYHFTFNGIERVIGEEPVAHVSFYEAQAFAEWQGARLLTEQEWERIAKEQEVRGSFLESENYSPSQPEKTGHAVTQMYGELWQWTSSSYSPYPGYQPLAGAVGEYNGKFMANQFVLRGGSCVSSQSHLRHTYRNFFYPDARWQFSGIRLAKDL